MTEIISESEFRRRIIEINVSEDCTESITEDCIDSIIDKYGYGRWKLVWSGDELVSWEFLGTIY